MKRFKSILVLALFFIISESCTAQQWDTTNAIPGVRYDDIYFHNATGWAVNADGQIYKTTDGGGSWNIQVNFFNRYFRSIEFLNENIGFAGTLDSLLLKTTDGGTTWTEIQDLIPVPIPGICGLSHIGDNVYGVGLFAYPAFFIKSTDQGQSWTHTDLSAFADGLVECHFVTTDIGFIAGIKENSGGVILKTIDGGDNWTEVLDTQGGAEYIWKLDFVTDQIAYGSIESFTGSNPSIVKTIDGGNSWTIHQVDTIYRDLQGIGFINQDTGWVSPRYHPMYVTTDGGITWATTNLYPNINRFFRINPELIYAAGSYIYKYGDFALSNQTIEPPIYLHSFSSIMPNPFNKALNFSIVIDRNTTIRLDLFNSSGQYIENFYSGHITQGEHEFFFNSQKVENLTAGIYYLVLRTNEGFITKSIVKTNVGE